MSEPIIADNKPCAVELVRGEQYSWCSCGMSKDQPMCDDSHTPDSTDPLEFSAEETGTTFLCVCKNTANPPYCDGSHAKFSDEEVGTTGLE